MPDSSAPRLIAAYFSDVDTDGHNYGPDSPQTDSAIARVDSLVGAIVDGIDRLGATDRIDVIVVSDHGMAEISSARTIALDDYVSMDSLDVGDFSPVATIIPKPGRDDYVFNALVREAKHGKERADRDRAIGALGQFEEPTLVKAALALLLDPELDARDTIRILWGATRRAENVPLAYGFLVAHFDALVARLPRDFAAGFPGVGAAFCDDARRPELEAFFGPRASRYVGGPRLLEQSLESLHLCHTFRVAQEPKVTAYFTKKPK